MKTTASSLLLRAPAAVIAVVTFVLSTPAHGQSWDGGDATSNSWGAANNWNPNVAPTFGTTADLTFNDLTRPDNDLGAARIVRSISYGANMDSAFQTNFRSFNGGVAAALTLQAASGNATITVDSGAAGNLSLGWSGVGTAGGALILGSNLDIIHNGTGVLNFNRQITGTGFGFTKSGTGTMQFGTGNANTLTGAVTVNAGRLIAASTAATTGDLNTVSGVTLGGGTLEIRTTNALDKVINPNLTVSSASTFAYNNTAVTDQSLTIGTGSMVLNANLTLQNISTSVAGNNIVNVSRALTGSGNLIIDTYNNVASGATSLSNGRVQLTGNNTAWTGNLVVAKGTVQFSGTSSFVPTAGSITLGTTSSASGAGLGFNQASTDVNVSNAITVTTGGVRLIRNNAGPGSTNDINLSGAVALNGDLTLDHGGLGSGKNMTISGNVTGAGGLNISRLGQNLVSDSSVRLTGDNSYTGATTVGTNATLRLSSATGGALASTSSVSVATSGTLLLGASNQINNTANVTLNGGTLKFDGAFTEGSTTSDGVGTLTLSANGSLDFASFGSTITFGAFVPSSFTLAVTNYVSGSSRLIFSEDEAGALSSFTINGGAVTQTNLGGGFYEITAVPEPGTIAGGLALVAAVAYRERRRLSVLLSQSAAIR